MKPVERERVRRFLEEISKHVSLDALTKSIRDARHPNAVPESFIVEVTDKLAARLLDEPKPLAKAVKRRPRA